MDYGISNQNKLFIIAVKNNQWTVKVGFKHGRVSLSDFFFLTVTKIIAYRHFLTHKTDQISQSMARLFQGELELVITPNSLNLLWRQNTIDCNKTQTSNLTGCFRKSDKESTNWHVLLLIA